MIIRELECPVCAGPRGFEQPPCGDRHEPGCPEWVCTRCGAALLLNPPKPDRRGVRLTGGRQRRLAA